MELHQEANDLRGGAGDAAAAILASDSWPHPGDDTWSDRQPGLLVARASEVKRWP